MVVLIILSLIAILCTYFESKGKLRNGMLLGFVILSAILGLRFEYGNDYISYSQKFLAYGLERFKFSDLTDGTISDPFWYLLNRLFYPFGFQTMVMFLTIVGSTAYYKLVRTLPKDLWVFGLFIYFFTNSFLPIQLSMLRQTLAMSLVIIAVLSILEKKYIYPLVLLVLASGIHSSAMICVPFILLLYLNFTKHKTIVTFGFIGLFLMFFFAKDIILNVLGSTLDSIDALSKYDNKYLNGNKYEASTTKSLFGFALYLFPVIINLIYLRKCRDEKMIKFTILYIFGAFIFLLDQVIPMMGRLAWYFTIFSIVSLPVAFKSIRGGAARIGLIVLFMAITLREYDGFFHALNWRDAYMHFQTIFSA